MGRKRNRGKAASGAAGGPPVRSQSQPRDQIARELQPNVLSAALAFEVSQHTGPLPSPAVLTEYAKIIPGGAERLVGWVEQQSTHRQTIETQRITADIANDSRGQWFAFVITIATVGCGTWLISTGKDLSGVAVVLGELTTLAGIFLFNKSAKTKELEKKIAALLAARGNRS